ncbi:uncharacterized protein LOC108111236 [Drosophila eugracilis]|uniref:uncharacterized protein LOC108111236 n=1 Tax=Drosophila eugracilis TaxID=29029 RepID=UPI0007E7F964|nr:uncharacterized protein LOC108111236 [Drosophila eugracilis]
MSCCCGTQTPRCCECPPGLRIDKTPQAPLFDMLGPQPDEVIIMILDRILYLSGATKIIPMLEWAGYGSAAKDSCPPSTCPSSHCSSATSSNHPSSSVWNTCCSKASSCCKQPRTCGSQKGSPKVPPVPHSPKPCCIKTPSRISAASSCPRQRTPRVDFDNPADNIPMRRKAGSISVRERMERSISSCSVACQQLKAKLASEEISGQKDQKWLWTRLTHGKNGCMVYEVYKDSDADSSPSSIRSEAPIILFLVMPNGCIMPFESISSP